MTMNASFEVLSEVSVPLSSPFFDPVAGRIDDNARVDLSWRPDGTAVAVSVLSVAPRDGPPPTRIVRTYDRTSLSLLSVGLSEDGSGKAVPGLRPSCLAWGGEGSSNLIASVQRKSKRVGAPMTVAFFEPNGLRHGEFKLRPDAGGASSRREEATGLCWNLEADLLAVSLECFVAETSDGDDDGGGEAEGTYGKVQLWSRSNYHWYLKHELRYPIGVTASDVAFDDESPYVLAVALRNGGGTAGGGEGGGGGSLEWRTYAFHWDASAVSSSSPSSYAADATAASIDGSILNLTPLHKALVPPPMYAASLDLGCAVNHVAFNPFFCDDDGDGGAKVSMVAVLSDGTIALLGPARDGDTKNGRRGLIADYEPPAVLAKTARWDVASADDASVDPTALRHFLVANYHETDGGAAATLGMVAASCPTSTCPFERLIEFTVVYDVAAKSAATAAVARVVRSIRLDLPALRVVNWSDRPSGALVELSDGSLLEYEPPPGDGDDGVIGGGGSPPRGGTLAPSDAAPTLEPCPRIAALRGDDDDDGGGSSRLVVGLSSRSRLYHSDRVLSSSASSFVLSPRHGFLSYATLGSRCLLKSLPLSELRNFDPLGGSDENASLLDGYEPRIVERGSRLASVLPGRPTAVLQLPRGNLEAVHPRALVLPFVMSKIDGGEYRSAFELMRTQRVDLNLIVDIDPLRFLEGGGAEAFVSEVGESDFLNLFVASLVDGDVTKWKYKVPSWFRRRKAWGGEEEAGRTGGEEGARGGSFDFGTKVNRVCEKLRDVMLSDERRDGEAEADDAERRGGGVGRFLLPVLSTFAKESPPKLERALGLIRDAALSRRVPPPPSPSSPTAAKRKSPLLSDAAQGSIHYLAFLSDYETLFDAALGMYDYDLARAVARNSQMDPRVYLPLIKRLSGLPERLGRYEVDVRLGRFESALTNLVLSRDPDGEGEDEEEHFLRCLSFAEEHKLHRLALELYEDRPRDEAAKRRRRRIVISLGERLLTERSGDAALAVFLSADPPDLDSAERAARSCGDWRTYFGCRAATEGEEGRRRKAAASASDIAEELAGGGGGVGGPRGGDRKENAAAAARIFLDYADDVDSAVDALAGGEMWSEARRVARHRGREDLVERVADGAVAFGRRCLDDFAERAEAFGAACERYRVVLEVRREARREGGGFGFGVGRPGDGDDRDDEGSLFSAASNASDTSLRSNASGISAGSVASVSSVISAGAVSTFSVTGSDADAYKHKSKFNKIGRGRKKKKKKKKGPAAKRRAQKGSEEELKSLIDTMKFNVIEKAYCGTIAETIQFLMQVGKVPFARELFEGYNDLKLSVKASQEKRMSLAAKEKQEAEQKARRDGSNYEHVAVWCEKEVDALGNEDLPKVVEQVFSFI